VFTTPPWIFLKFFVHKLHAKLGIKVKNFSRISQNFTEILIFEVDEQKTETRKQHDSSSLDWHISAKE